jgi:hypothetical protein
MYKQKYFGNIDMVFSGDRYQAQSIHNFLIFEHPTMNMKIIVYDFWRDSLKCYELHTTIQQTNQKIIAILNMMCTNSQTRDDLEYINMNCIRPTPNHPTFHYQFYKNKGVPKGVGSNGGKEEFFTVGKGSIPMRA